jgi:hypothetical protein
LGFADLDFRILSMLSASRRRINQSDSIIQHGGNLKRTPARRETSPKDFFKETISVLELGG